MTRRDIWANLCMHKDFIKDKPWVIMGDFNSALHLEDQFLGSSSINISMKEFQECVAKIEVDDVNAIGIHYTWNQKPKNGAGIFKKIDRIMGNVPFMDSFQLHVLFSSHIESRIIVLVC